MQIVTLNFTNEDARVIAKYLRAKYGRDKRTGLRELCDIAVRVEAGTQASAELEEAERELALECLQMDALAALNTHEKTQDDADWQAYCDILDKLEEMRGSVEVG